MKIYTIKTDLQMISDYNYEPSESEFCSDIEDIVRVSETKLQKHNLVMGYWEKPELLVYNVEEYLDYYCSSNEAETDSEYSRPLSVFVIFTNRDELESETIHNMIKSWKSNEKIMKSKAILYFLYLSDGS